MKGSDGPEPAHAEIWLMSKPLTSHSWQPTWDTHWSSCALQSSKHWTSPALTQSEQSFRHAGKYSSSSYEYEYEFEFESSGLRQIEIAENGLLPCGGLVVWWYGGMASASVHSSRMREEQTSDLWRCAHAGYTYRSLLDARLILDVPRNFIVIRSLSLTLNPTFNNLGSDPHPDGTIHRCYSNHQTTTPWVHQQRYYSVLLGGSVQHGPAQGLSKRDGQLPCDRGKVRICAHTHHCLFWSLLLSPVEY